MDLELGYPLPKRLSTFKELDPKRDKISTEEIKIGGVYQPIDVYKISINLPKYRLDNTRTLDLQEQYVYENNKDKDFFEDVESDEVQRIQHLLLKKVIDDKDLMSYFRKEQQTKPLILTHNGFVISGNRRLCAYRELLEESPAEFKHFNLIKVAILPLLPAEIIEQIEDYLEQEKDIKEPFNWVSKAMGIRRRMAKWGYDDKKLSEITGFKKTEINELLNKLELAENYLESVGKPKEYSLVIEDEFAYEKILDCEDKEKNPGKKKTFEKLAFLSLKNKGEFTGRMYSNVPLIYEAQSLIQEEISKNFSDELKELEKKYPVKDLLGNPIQDSSIATLKLLEDPLKEKRIVEIIVDQTERVLELKRETKRGSAVLNKVQKAHSYLVEANMVVSDDTKKDGILNQIENIEKEIQKLKTWLNSK